MQQQSFILSLRQRFKWLPKVSLPKLPSSICTRTTEVGGGKLSAETSALPRVRKGFLPASRLWALLQLPLHWQKVQPFLFCMEVRCRYRSVYVNPFRQTQFQAYSGANFDLFRSWKLNSINIASKTISAGGKRLNTADFSGIATRFLYMRLIFHIAKARMQNIKHQYKDDKQHNSSQAPKQPCNPNILFPKLFFIQSEHIFIDFIVHGSIFE